MQKSDPLNPDSEQKLYEQLSNSKDDLDDLEFIRRMMKRIVKWEEPKSLEKKE